MAAGNCADQMKAMHLASVSELGVTGDRIAGTDSAISEALGQLSNQIGADFGNNPITPIPEAFEWFSSYTTQD